MILMIRYKMQSELFQISVAAQTCTVTLIYLVSYLMLASINSFIGSHCYTNHVNKGWLGWVGGYIELVSGKV
jgi:hypothetical protein